MVSGRLNILDVWVDPVDMQHALGRIEQFVNTGSRAHSVFAVNPEKNFSVPRDKALYRTFQNADLLIPDGIGVVMAARLLYGAKIARVPGVELMEELLRLAAVKGYTLFLFGGKEEVNKRAVEVAQQRYPGLRIVGRANGYVTEAEMPALIDQINASGAQLLFLALGSPRQEAWFTRYGGQLETVRVCQGVGGSLDVMAGKVPRAPLFWRRLSLEWFYRLACEPKRIVRQRVLPLFALAVGWEKLRLIMGTSRPLSTGR